MLCSRKVTVNGVLIDLKTPANWRYYLSTLKPLDIIYMALLDLGWKGHRRYQIIGKRGLQPLNYR